MKQFFRLLNVLLANVAPVLRRGGGSFPPDDDDFE